VSDEDEHSDQFRLRQLSGPYPTHYVSTTVERNSRGFTTTLKATVELVGDPDIDDAESAKRIQRVNNLLLAAGQLNIEYRKLLITLCENLSSHDEAVARARADFDKWMAEFTESPSGD
jgi:hypothetical protein